MYFIAYILSPDFWRERHDSLVGCSNPAGSWFSALAILGCWPWMESGPGVIVYFLLYFLMHQSGHIIASSLKDFTKGYKKHLAPPAPLPYLTKSSEPPARGLKHTDRSLIAVLLQRVSTFLSSQRQSILNTYTVPADHPGLFLGIPDDWKQVSD